MSEEKKLILKMLKEDKITEDEAIKLLDAIGDKKGDDYQKEQFVDDKFNQESFEKKVESFAEKVVSSVDIALKKAGEAIKEVELGYDFDVNFGKGKGFSFTKLKSTTNKEITIPKDLSFRDVEIFNTNGTVNVQPWDKDEITVKSEIKYDDKYVDENYEFIKYKLEEDILIVESVNNDYKKQPFVANMEIFVPSTLAVERFTIDTVNGSISVTEFRSNDLEVKSVNGAIKTSELYSNNVNLSTVNGHISARESYGDDLNIESVNGGVEAFETYGKKLKMETVNGRLQVTELYGEELSATTVNGSISIDEINNVSKKIRLESVNGSATLNLDGANKETKLFISSSSRNIQHIMLPQGFKITDKSKKEITATTAGYNEGLEDKLDVEISTVNGRLSIEA